ncbi:MAG TPA: hypothetical protein VE932_09025 [Patescibacteria group bacterium]|nr:hypothetical protein [Patescibacteria group bacterium]
MTNPEPVYDVVWPLAPSAAPAGSLAARSPDLSGKTVGELWDYLFKGEEMFPLIRKALETRYPGIRFVEFEVFGSIHGRDEQELAATLPGLLRKHGCDAVISAVGA